MSNTLTFCTKFTSRKVHISCCIGKVARGTSLRNSSSLGAVVTSGAGAPCGIILWVRSCSPQGTVIACITRSSHVGQTSGTTVVS